MRILHRSFIHIALIVSVVFLIYSNTFTAPFEFDDVSNIVDNTAIRSIHNFIDTSHFEKAEILESLRPILTTRYIGYLSFALNYSAHGLDVKGYHLVNILIHLVNSLLVYAIVLSTFRTPYFSNRKLGGVSNDSCSFIAIITALLFAVHPIQTQAVTYIVQRFASLAALFYLLSLLGYIRCRICTFKIRSRAFYVLSLISAIVAMKTKEFALLLPIVITLYEFTFFEGAIKKRILRLIPLLLTISIIPLSMLSTSAANVSGANVAGVTRASYLFTQFRVIITYLRLLIFPVNQNVDYDYPVYRSFFVPEVLLSFAFLLSLFAVGVWLFQSSSHQERETGPWFRLAACGLFWFFLTAAPESSIIPIKDVIFEHRMYLPSIGLFLAFTVTIELAWLRLRGTMHFPRKVPVLLMIGVIAAFSAATYARNNVWKDSVRLWEDIARKSPNKPGPRYNLGVAYAEQGRVADAVASYTETIRINPLYSTDVYNNLGLSLMALGRVDEAIRMYEHASGIATLDCDIHANLANAYMAKGRIDDAISEYKAAVQLKPDNVAYHFCLGVAYSKRGLDNEAVNEYIMVLRLRPDDVEIRNNLGNIYNKLGRMAEALNEYQLALRIKPDFAEAHYNLGKTFATLGRQEEARNEYRTALKLKPDFIEARRQLEK